MRGGSWRFIVQYNRIAEQNTIKGRQPYPRNINLAGLWSTWGLLHEIPWPGEGKGFQLHLLTLSRAAVSVGSPSYSHLAGSPASWLSLRDPQRHLRISTQESWMVLSLPHWSCSVLPSLSASYFFSLSFMQYPFLCITSPLVFRPQQLKAPQTASIAQVCVL